MANHEATKEARRRRAETHAGLASSVPASEQFADDSEPVTLVLVSRERLEPWFERMLDQPASATESRCARIDEDVLRDHGF